jgi:hypothetical protein
MVKRATLLAGGIASAAALAFGLGAGTASAAPIPVYQVPASGLAVSGLVVPGPWFVNIHAETTNVPGQVAFSAPTTPYYCSASSAGALVRIDYINLSRGNTGSVMVKPCYNFLEPTPFVANANTGSGQIAFTTNIVGSKYSPRAGQPALPGGGTLNVG